MASSRHVNDMVTAFKTKMGDTNFLIVNALRKLEEERETAQRVALEVAEQGAQAECPPPPPEVRIQLDGTMARVPE